MTVEALTDRDGKQANTSLEEEEKLRDKSFPPNDGDQYYQLPRAGIAHTLVTEQAVKRSIFSQSVKKAPGPDMLSFGPIRLLGKWDKVRIVRLTRAAIRMGRHPAVCKRASGVVICTPGKAYYTNLKAYCSISLLSCTGKVVEKVAAKLMSEEAERRGLLSEGQFRSRKGRSAINAAATMVDRAHAAWTNGDITEVFLRDIKAAFLSVGQRRLVNLINVMQMDRDVTQWTESFLSEITVEMIIECNVMERQTEEEGVPQSSPVSPSIFVIYTSGIIKWVEEYVSEAQGLSGLDHLGWVATRCDVNHVITISERCAAKSIDWASRRGVQFDTAKTEAALFTRRPGHRKHLRPILYGKIRVGNGSIRFNAQPTCSLGVWMDAHLTFKEHHDRCMTKARAANARL